MRFCRQQGYIPAQWTEKGSAGMTTRIRGLGVRGPDSAANQLKAVRVG